MAKSIKKMTQEELKSLFETTLEAVREARVQAIMHPGPKAQKKLQTARAKLNIIASRMQRY